MSCSGGVWDRLSRYWGIGEVVVFELLLLGSATLPI